MVPIASLTQESKRWSAKVLLVEKSHRRKTKQLGKEFQRYIFVNEAGTQIQGMSYTPDTTIVDTVLQPIQDSGNFGSGKEAMLFLKHKILKSIVLRRTKMGRAADLALPSRIVSYSVLGNLNIWLVSALEK